jgi:magnesium chelatase family protein
LLRKRPFRDPHHSASMPALVGGGLQAKPGEISLAHHGVLFLDELPEFARGTLEALRQPLESGKAVVARANAHVTYPSRVQLIAAMNPCRCGYLSDPSRSCSRAPKCALDYQAKISGPLFDRIDLHIELPEISAEDLMRAATGEPSAVVADRVLRVREIQDQRYSALGVAIRLNALADGELLDAVATPDAAGQELLKKAAESFKLSARVSAGAEGGPDARRYGERSGRFQRAYRRSADLPPPLLWVRADSWENGDVKRERE